nr:hypothetical protein [Tanacetum cinerariifolium]
MDQAPAAFDGFAPYWFGEQFLNINNGWIEWDVPLGGEVDEPMVDPEVNEEVMDDDDLDVEVEWLMDPVTPPRATMTVSSTYEVGGPSTAAIEGPSFPLPAPGLPVPPTVIEDLGTRLGNLDYRHGVLTRKMKEVSDAVVADSIAIGEIHPRVATVGEQVQVVEAQTVQVVSRLEEIETRVQQVESRVDTQSSGQMAVQGLDVIAGSSEQERLNVLEKRLPGPPPGPQYMTLLIVRSSSRRKGSLDEQERASAGTTLTLRTEIDLPRNLPSNLGKLGLDPKSSQDHGFQPSSDDGKKVDEDTRQESECKDQEKEDNVNNTNNVNDVGTNGVNAVGANTNNGLLFDPEMPALEDISRFNFSSDHKDGDEDADMNNLDTTI